MPAHLTHTDLRGDELPLGRVAWVDSNGHRLPDNEAGSGGWSAGYPLAGIAVSLQDGSGHELARTITDARGNYVFDDLPLGQYTVVFTAPSSATAPADDTGSDHPIWSAEGGLNLEPVDVMLDELCAPTPIQTWTVSPTGWGDRASVLRVAGTLG